MKLEIIMPIDRKLLRLHELMYEQDTYDVLLESHKNMFVFFSMDKFEANVLSRDSNPMIELNMVTMIKKELNEINDRKPLLSPNESGKHYVFELFLEDPSEWITEGSRYLWAYLSRSFSNDLLPMKENDFIYKYLKLIGDLDIPYGKDETVFVKKFSHFDSNDGEISGVFTTKALDTLLSRLKIANSNFD